MSQQVAHSEPNPALVLTQVDIVGCHWKHDEEIVCLLS